MSTGQDKGFASIYTCEPLVPYTREMDNEHQRPLRRGWTTGACATAAAKTAAAALLSGVFPDPVTITLPNGQQPAFALARHASNGEYACAAIIKDAGDDPDVTHLAVVEARLSRGPVGSGITFAAGKGVGMVTRAGLPIPPGEPAINPVPRQMIARELIALCAEHNTAADLHVEISIDGGEELALKTLNPRLGILGGLSILGTTGIVIPYSCSAWIHSIYRGIDVARAAGITHIAGATGSASEAAVQKLCDLPDIALIDMGDFVGGMLKYVRTHPIKRITIAGGIAKMTKLAQGFLDLHSKHGRADLMSLANMAAHVGASSDLCAAISVANTVAEAFGIAQRAGFSLGGIVADSARQTCVTLVGAADIELDTVIFNRDGELIGRSSFRES
jgi:cobalt-precorrin-5B (C1)-methyltransferase